MPAIPGRSRGRVRGSRGRSIGRGQRSHGISRDSLSVKSIAMNRPRCIGALKHTPDPERIKELFSPVRNIFLSQNKSIIKSKMSTVRAL